MTSQGLDISGPLEGSAMTPRHNARCHRGSIGKFKLALHFHVILRKQTRITCHHPRSQRMAIESDSPSNVRACLCLTFPAKQTHFAAAKAIPSLLASRWGKTLNAGLMADVSCMALGRGNRSIRSAGKTETIVAQTVKYSIVLNNIF